MSGVITTNLIGGFGNQLFQYAFARAYAEQIEATLQTPPWVGQRIFDLIDPSVETALPERTLQELHPGETNVALRGYFQNQTALDHYSRADVRRWFRLRPWAVDVAADLPRHRLAAHRRVGDYVGLGFVIVSVQSYRRACEVHELAADDLVFVTEEQAQRMPDCDAAGVPFLPDFLRCMRAEVLLRGNSTFSWWAAALGTGRVFAPLVADLQSGERDVDFVEGNHPRCISYGDLTDLYLREA